MTADRSDAESVELDRTVQLRHTHRSLLLVGGILPFAITVVATVLMLSWLPELPNPIAVHWSETAGPDGYGPALPFILIPPGFIVLFCAVMIASVWKLQPSGRPRSTQKFIVVMNVWLSAFVSIGLGGTLAIQRGLGDATQAGGIGTQLLLGVAVSLILAAGSWFLLPASDNSQSLGVAPSALPLGATERVAWSHVVMINPWVLLILGSTVVLLAGFSVFALVSTSSAAPIAITVFALVVLAVSGTLYWRVSADRRGLTVRSVLGWPRVRIRPDEIASVTVVEVNPMTDFGGWGYRWMGGGRSGIVMRAGEAIEVTRNNGKRFVVTVDDAKTGAGVLAALLAQSG